MAGEYLTVMNDYLNQHGCGYSGEISKMVLARNNGKVFSFPEHIAGFVYALLTNQTKWSRIVPHLSEIDELFFHYDPVLIKAKDGPYFASRLFALKCGNISTSAQMDNLSKNIETMECIISEFGSMDTFITSEPAYKIVKKLSGNKSKYKMKMMGEALVWEYIRNVGIDACKPDTHLRRFLGNARMGQSKGRIASVDETVHQVSQLSRVSGLSQAAIDNIIWSFCADGYGEVCTATPHCENCVIRQYCKHL